MLSEFINKKLTSRKKANLLRHRVAISNRSSSAIHVGNEVCINFTSNDYLGLSTHPAVKKAFIEGVRKYGLGSTSSALISGYYQPHHILEEKMAEFLGREKAILFNSGYAANLGVMSSLADRHSHIVADKFCHASLLDGIQLSRANLQRYRHNDMQHLESLLNENKNNSFVVTESLFGMRGDITPIDKIVSLTKKYAVELIVDDAHAIGVLGKSGRGIMEYFNLQASDVTCLVTPLGKALGGTGAIVSGAASMIETLLQFSRSYGYTTALPPAIAVALISTLWVLQNETWRREKLNHLIQYFINQAKARKIKLISDELTPVKSIFMGDNKLTTRAAEKMKNKGILISCIRPPTVPMGESCLKISLTCEHEEQDIDKLLDQLTDQLC